MKIETHKLKSVVVCLWLALLKACEKRSVVLEIYQSLSHSKTNNDDRIAVGAALKCKFALAKPAQVCQKSLVSQVKI